MHAKLKIGGGEKMPREGIEREAMKRMRDGPAAS